MGSFYLNALGDASGLVPMPSPPAVIMDMAGSILDVALAYILEESDDALVVEAVKTNRSPETSWCFPALRS